MLTGPDNKVVGSRQSAQPFTKDEYFQPRPSAASHDASASTSSAVAASNNFFDQSRDFGVAEIHCYSAQLKGSAIFTVVNDRRSREATTHEWRCRPSFQSPMLANDLMAKETA